MDPAKATVQAVLHQGPSHGTVLAVPAGAERLEIDTDDGACHAYAYGFYADGTVHYCYAGTRIPEGPAPAKLIVPGLNDGGPMWRTDLGNIEGRP